MRSLRSLSSRAIVLLIALAAITLPAATAGADQGDELAQLAPLQTQWYTNYARANALVSPQNCNAGQPGTVNDGAFFLPVLSTNSTFGTTTVNCTINSKKTSQVLLDAGGIVATEDDPAVCPGFTPQVMDGLTLQDLSPFLPSGSATLDGQPLPTTLVASAGFMLNVMQNDPYPGCKHTNRYEVSVALGHPGQIYTRYFGYKALIPLDPGQHVLTVSAFGNTIIYNIRVV